MSNQAPVPPNVQFDAPPLGAPNNANVHIQPGAQGQVQRNPDGSVDVQYADKQRTQIGRAHV